MIKGQRITKTARRTVSVTDCMLEVERKVTAFCATPELDRLIDFLGQAAARNSCQQAAAIRLVATLSLR